MRGTPGSRRWWSLWWSHGRHPALLRVMLRTLQRLDIPCVDPVAVITNRTSETGEALESCLVTRHLKFSLPYRAMWSQGLRPETATRLVDALMHAQYATRTVGK